MNHRLQPKYNGTQNAGIMRNFQQRASTDDYGGFRLRIPTPTVPGACCDKEKWAEDEDPQPRVLEGEG